MADKSIIIIGAGIAGLSAGCYAQMNGFRSKIVEMHDLPGGLCTAWERKGYIFDGCIHYLFGTGQGQPFNAMWQELGALQDRPVVDQDEYIRISDGQHVLTVYTNPDRLQEHMLSLSPQDAHLIKPFMRGVRHFQKFDLSILQVKPRALMTPQDWAAMGKTVLPYALDMAKWGTLSMGEFARQFRHPFLRRAVAQMFSWDEAPAMMGMCLLAYMHNKNAGFPTGASLEFARAIERRYLALGGEIEYKAQVEKILVENNRAVGVRLYNDAVYRADTIISAADGRSTIFDMLGGAYVDKAVQKRYDGHLPVHTQLQVSLGVNRDLSAEPHWVTYLLDEPVLIAGQEHREIGVKHYGFDPSLAPAGKSVVEVMIRSDYAYWQRIYGRRPYDSEQRQVSAIVIDLLEKWYPGISAQVEYIDEATPLSYERYTGNWLGSTSGFLLSKETMPMLIQGLPKTLPGLKAFYMAGQWVEPGGSVPLVAASGKNAIQLICHAEGLPFTTSLPTP